MKKKYFCKCCGREILNSNHGTTYCRKHGFQLEKYGKFLDSNPRNKFDPNEFRFLKDNIVEFDVYSLYTFNVIATFKIDAEDYPLVSKYKWSLSAQGYARTLKDGKFLLLHRLILDPKEGQQVDHINLDIKDNRKSNLRIADNSLNSSNRKPYNKLGVKGVEYHKNINKYSAYLRVYHKQYHSPCYSTIEEASFARFILEQCFRKESLTQFSDYSSLTEIQKEKIINDIKIKFNL